MLIAMMTLVILAEILLLSVTYVNYDRGQGSDTGRWLYVSFLGGAKLMPWWVDLNDGPGNATSPGQNCGHKFPRHCNSGHCGQTWCNVQRWPVFPKLFVIGHQLRVWCGPTYNRGKFSEWRIGFRKLRTWKRVHPYGDTYSMVSFR